MPNMDGQEALVGFMDGVLDDGVAVLRDGVPIACMGVLRVHKYRGIAWALLAAGYRRDFIQVHRAARQVLEDAPYARIDTYADPMRPESGRWLAMLGFDLETAYKPFMFPDGRGAAEWVLIK